MSAHLLPGSEAAGVRTRPPSRQENMFASVIMTDCVVSESDVVERRNISEAAP